MTERRSSALDRIIRLKDGRLLGYAEFGDPEGEPVLHFHGMTSSRLDGNFAHVSAQERGLHLLSIDRPGMGLSDFQPGRTFLDWPNDIAEFADQLGIHRFSLLGTSAGGIYALACGAKLPERIEGIVIINGFGPGGLDPWAPGPSIYSRMVFGVLPRWAPWLLPPIFRRVAKIADEDPQRLLKETQEMVPKGERALMGSARVVEVLLDTMHEAYRSGVDGAVWEVRMLSGAWDFSPEDVHVPVRMFHGEDNSVVTAATAAKLAASLPDATLQLVPGIGHLPSLQLMDEAADALISAPANAARA